MSYLNYPDPHSIAVPDDPTSCSDYDPPVGDLSCNWDDPASYGPFLTYSSCPLPYELSWQLGEMDRRRMAIESLAQTHMVLLQSHDDTKNLCLREYESMVSSLQERVNEMKHTTINERAWITFCAVVKHRLERDERRSWRQSEQINARRAARKLLFDVFQAKWKSRNALQKLTFSLLSVTRRSSYRDLLGGFQKRLRSRHALQDVIARLLSAARKNSHQTLLDGFQKKCRSRHTLQKLICRIFTSRRRSMYQTRLALFVFKQLRLTRLCDIFDRYLHSRRRFSCRTLLERFQVKWKNLYGFWSLVSCLLTATRRTFLKALLDGFQRKLRCKKTWRLFKSLAVVSAGRKLTNWIETQRRVLSARKNRRALWKKTASQLVREHMNAFSGLLSVCSRHAKIIDAGLVQTRKQWSTVIAKMRKDRREVVRRLIILNYQDIIHVTITSWEDIVSKMRFKYFFIHASFLRKWSRLCRSGTRRLRFIQNCDIGMNFDMKRMLATFDRLHDYKEHDPEKEALFQATYGLWPRIWKEFKLSKVNIFCRMMYADRKGSKLLYQSVFLSAIMYLESASKLKSIECPGSSESYLETVQRMYAARFCGLVTIDWNDVSLFFHIPLSDSSTELTFRFHMREIKHIVGFYYESCSEVHRNMLRFFPLGVISHRKAISFNVSELNVCMGVIKTELAVRYLNRFSITYSPSRIDGVRLRIKCRMVRKVDGKVSSEGKWHECGIFEAIEQLRRGVFDTLLRDVIELEKRMKVEHRYGPLLEYYEGSD